MGNKDSEPALTHTKLRIFDKYPEYKKKGKNRHFWTTRHYVDIVDRNEEQIRKYTKEQSEADKIEDNK